MRCWRLRQLILLCCLLLVKATLLAATDSGGEPQGLYVHNGVLMRAGRPYSGIGANYDTLFGRLLKNKDDTSSLDNLALLAKKGIPFVRFRACGFYPDNLQLYLNDRSEYFRRMDQVVRTAEQNHIGLIPSLFWRLATFSEVVAEPESAFGNAQSKSRAFITQYTREIVGRYKDSPAIWGWEFGNEANLAVDVPHPKGGVHITSDQLIATYIAFARTVRSIDPSRIIDAGISVQRPAAWHNAHGALRQRDSPSQNYAQSLADTPDPMNVVSVHIYQKGLKLAPYGPETVSHFIARYVSFTSQTGKPLFIGEFPVREPAQAQEFLRAMQENHVPLAAFWTFDNSAQEATMNVSFQNQRAFAIDLVANANKALQSGR